MARDAVLRAHASSVSVCSNDLLAPRESARGAVSLLSVKNKSGERTRRDAQLRVTAARSAAVTSELTGARSFARPVERLVRLSLIVIIQTITERT